MKNENSLEKSKEIALAAADLAAAKVFPDQKCQSHEFLSEYREKDIIFRQIFVNYPGPQNNFIVVELKGVPRDNEGIIWTVEGVCTPGNRDILNRDELEKLNKEVSCQNG